MTSCTQRMCCSRSSLNSIYATMPTRYRVPETLPDDKDRFNNARPLAQIGALI